MSYIVDTVEKVKSHMLYGQFAMWLSGTPLARGEFNIMTDNPTAGGAVDQILLLLFNCYLAGTIASMENTLLSMKTLLSIVNGEEDGEQATDELIREYREAQGGVHRDSGQGGGPISN